MSEEKTADRGAVVVTGTSTGIGRATAVLKTVATDRMLDRLMAWQLKLPKKA